MVIGTLTAAMLASKPKDDFSDDQFLYNKLNHANQYWSCSVQGCLVWSDMDEMPTISIRHFRVTIISLKYVIFAPINGKLKYIAIVTTLFCTEESPPPGSCC